MTTNYVYKRTEFSPYCLYTVGYYDPDGKWQSESDHETSEDAAKKTAYLNGGANISYKLIIAAPNLLESLTELFNLLEENEPKWYLKGHYNRAIKAIKKATE